MNHQIGAGSGPQLSRRTFAPQRALPVRPSHRAPPWRSSFVKSKP